MRHTPHERAFRWIGEACINSSVTIIGVERRLRLTRSADFQRVRRIGKTFPHPLIVLVVVSNDLPTTRFGVVAGRTVGTSVKRNRAKRLIRAALRELVASIEPGWDMIIIARRPMSDSNFHETLEALKFVLTRARVLRVDHASPSIA